MNDLRDHMFAQLERLEDENITNDQLEIEIKRAKSIKNIADTLIESAKTEIEFLKISDSKPSHFLLDETKNRIENKL